MKKAISIILLGVPLFSFLMVSAEEIKIVAKVNNTIITSKDLENFRKVLSLHLNSDEEPSPSDEELEQKALNKLIEDKLILELAQKENIQIPPSLIEAKLNELISRFSSRQEFEEALIGRGLNLTLLREQIKEQYMMRHILDKYVEAAVSISPQEVNRFYQEYPHYFMVGPRYVFWIARSFDKNKLVELAKLIKENGIDKNDERMQLLTPLEAGKEELLPEVVSLLEGMKEKDLVIKKIGRLDCLIYLERMVPSQVLSFEEAKERVKMLLQQKKFEERYRSWMEGLKQKALIKIYEENL